jgi:hypothetical protein
VLSLGVLGFAHPDPRSSRDPRRPGDTRDRARATAWLEMSGAKSYEPFLCVERAELARLTGDEAARERELREAHRLFNEIGAPIRAAEVAKVLDSSAAS